MLPSFFYNKFPDIKSRTFLGTLTDQKFVVQSINANKIACVEFLDEDFSLYCDLNISHLFH